MKKRVIIILVSVVLCLGIVGGIFAFLAMQKEDEPPTVNTGYTRELVESLGLCFTEGKVTNLAPEALASRFKDYTDMGLKTIRHETGWVSFSKGSWAMSGDSQTILQAAVDAGLRLKLVLPTISNPQTWVTGNPASQMRNYNGAAAVNTLSYWYDGIYDYTTDAINCQLAQLKELGFLDDLDALVVDFGPAAEPLYPAAWTQGGSLDNPNNAATSMWCYDDNAVADFKATMLTKYGSIEQVNEAWGTNLSSMDMYEMPKPGTVSGQQWEDILTWYLESKREFVEKQIQIFKEAVNTHTDGRVQLILYMPGSSFTQAEWDECIQKGDATFSMLIGCENEFMVQMADKYGCLLQFTGLPGIEPLKQIRQWMYTNGYGDIPVFGENYADLSSSQDPEALYQTIEDFNLAGIDYTFTKFLCNDDGVTLSDIGHKMAATLPKIAEFIHKTDFSKAPYMLTVPEAKPEGDILALHTKLISTPDLSASARARIATFDYQIQEGDVLEYDVKISVPSNGFGFIDGVVSDAGTLRSMIYCVDQFGITAAAAGQSLAVQAGGKWVHRILSLDIPYCSHNSSINTTGKILRDINLLAQPIMINGAFAADEISVYYDNIVITNNGEVKLVIFQSGTDLKEYQVQDQWNLTAEIKIETYTP